MATFLPESQIENNLFNPNKFVARRIFNNGYLLTQDFLVDYQKLMQDAVQNAFVDFAKYPGLVASGFPLYITPNIRSFELLGHQLIGGSPYVHRFIINAGTAYDAYGNRLSRSYRTTVDLAMSSLADTNGYAYLCVRKLNNYAPIDYIENPVVGIPQATKVLTDVEFYLADGIFEALSDPLLLYPPLDDNELIEGIVIAKISKTVAPDPSLRTALIAVKDGNPQDIPGYVEINPSVID